MKSAPSIGRIFGVRVRLHYTWSLAFALIMAIVFTQFPETYSLRQRIILGVAAGLLFFAIVSIREFVLSFMASRRGLPLKIITLFAFGGVSQINREDTSPTLEFLLAMTGLLSNLVVAGILYGIYAGLVNFGSVAFAGLVQWLAFIYFMLFLFHFIPGFPLEGGRFLRALLWRSTGDYNRATRIATWTGRGIGLICIVGGILLLIFGRQWFVGLTLAGTGWVLQSASAQSRRQAVVGEALENITAGDIMNKECPFINQQLSLSQLVQDCILVKGQWPLKCPLLL